MWNSFKKGFGTTLGVYTALNTILLMLNLMRIVSEDSQENSEQS